MLSPPSFLWTNIDIQREKRKIPRKLISVPLLREDQVRAIKKRGEKRPKQMHTVLRSRAIADTMDSIAELFLSMDVSVATNLSESEKVYGETLRYIDD
jgi:hypothetical protein